MPFLIGKRPFSAKPKVMQSYLKTLCTHKSVAVVTHPHSSHLTRLAESESPHKYAAELATDH